MSVGLFSSLPEDIISVIWGNLDAQGLASAAKVCRAFWSRADTETLWKAEAMKFLDFNTVLTPELVASPLPRVPHWFVDPAQEGREKIINHLKMRYQNLESTGTLKPFKAFGESLNIKGHLQDDDLLDDTVELSWKFVFKALSYFFETRNIKDYEVQSKAAKALFGIARRSPDQEKVTAAIKALCTISRDYRDPSDFELDLTSTFPHESILPIIMENFFMVSETIRYGDDYEEGAWREIWKIFSRMEDPILLFWVLHHEQTEYSSIQKSIDHMMYAYTHTYITKTLGPSRVFQRLVEQIGIQDLVSTVEGDEIDKIIKVAKSIDDQRVTRFTRIVCVLLIHILGFGDYLLTDLLGVYSDAVVESIVLRGIQCHPSPDSVKRHLKSFAGSPNIKPRARLLLAYLSIKFGEDPNSVDLTDVPGYPLPWTGVVPMPQNLREAILRAHRYSLAPSCNPAIEVEAARLSPSPPRPKSTVQYVPYSDEDEDTTDFQFIDGVKVYGPIDCTTLQQMGQNPGTYSVYKVFTDITGHRDQQTPGMFSREPYFRDPLANFYVWDADNVLYTTSLLLICKFAPFAAIVRNDGFFSLTSQSGTMYIESRARWERNSNGQSLPSFQLSCDVLNKLAEKLQVSVVPDSLLRCMFHGLKVKLYSDLGSENTVQQLLFFWDYYRVSVGHPSS